MPTRLEALMHEQMAAPFPDCDDKGEDYGEVDPVMIDADIYGFATCVRDGQGLGDVGRQRLQACRDGLVRSLDALPGRARPYYEQLVELADAALAEDQCQ